MSGRFDALCNCRSGYAAAVSSRDAQRSDRQFWLVAVCVCVGGLLWASFFFWLAWVDDTFTRNTVKAALPGVLGIAGLVFGLNEIGHRLRQGPQEPGRRAKRPDAPGPIRLRRRPTRR